MRDLQMTLAKDDRRDKMGRNKILSDALRTAGSDGKFEMKFFGHHRALANISSSRVFRRSSFLALACVLPLLISGCGKENSSAGVTTGVQSVEHNQATSFAISVFDLAGQRVDPFDAADAKAVIFIFLATECPISNRYAPEIRRLAEKFARTGIKFKLVYADPDVTPDAIRNHLKEFQLPPEALRDPQHGLVKLSQVRVTPEAAVFLPGRHLVYHGRIDNRYADFGKDRPEATEHDLESVLGAVLQGKPAPYSTARAVGCYIPDAETSANSKKPTQ